MCEYAAQSLPCLQNSIQERLRLETLVVYMKLVKNIANALSAFVANHRQAVGLFLVTFVFLALATSARADTDVDALVQACTTLWGTVKALIITIAGFSLLIWVVMKIRKH